VLGELKEKLRNLVRDGTIENTETVQVLILSGSHGNPDMGDSGVTNLDKLRDCNAEEEGDVTFGFYKRECRIVGVKPDKSRPKIAKLPIPENEIPDITEPMKKLNPKIFQKTFLSDEMLSKITFKVIDIAHYYQHKEKLVADIKKLNPKVLAIAWCFSLNGDMAMALRREGVFVTMVMEHDLRLITGNPDANLDEDQISLIERIVEFDKEPNEHPLYFIKHFIISISHCISLKKVKVIPSLSCNCTSQYRLIAW
jgi:hypothetical protein